MCGCRAIRNRDLTCELNIIRGDDGVTVLGYKKKTCKI